MAFTPYFNPANADDQRLLPPIMRSAQDLPELAALVEADVINQYTKDLSPEYLSGVPWGRTWWPTIRAATQLFEDDTVTPTTRWVFLRGFAQDSASASAGLKLAMKRAIAEVIRWRAATWKADLLVESTSDQQGQSKTMRKETLEPWPIGWNRWLEQYDSREPCWGW